jgi:hypothetical protein
VNGQQRKKTKHHYVPAFYLRFFAEDSKIATIERATGKRRDGDPKDTAAIKDFYTFVDKAGNERDDLEGEFAQLEGAAHSIISNVNSDFCLIPHSEQKEILALFIGLQALRTPMSRRSDELMSDYITKLDLRVKIHDLESATNALRGTVFENVNGSANDLLMFIENITDFDFVPHQNEAVAMMMKLWPVAAYSMLFRKWTVVCFEKPSLITSDHPVMLHGRRTPTTGVGFANAEVISFPLSPTRLLVMTEAEQAARVHRGSRAEGTQKGARSFNRALIQASYLQYFMPPSIADHWSLKALGPRALESIKGPFPDLEERANRPPVPQLPARLNSFKSETHAPPPHPAPPKAP